MTRPPALSSQGFIYPRKVSSTRVSTIFALWGGVTQMQRRDRGVHGASRRAPSPPAPPAGGHYVFTALPLSSLLLSSLELSDTRGLCALIRAHLGTAAFTTHSEAKARRTRSVSTHAIHSRATWGGALCVNRRILVYLVIYDSG